MTKPNEIPWTPFAAAVYDPAYGELVQELNDQLIHDGVSLKTSIHIMATVTSHLPQINASVREKELQEEVQRGQLEREKLQRELDEAVFQLNQGRIEAAEQTQEAQRQVAEAAQVVGRSDAARQAAMQMAEKRRADPDCDEYSRNIFWDIHAVLAGKVPPPLTVPGHAQA